MRTEPSIQSRYVGNLTEGKPTYSDHAPSQRTFCEKSFRRGTLMPDSKSALFPYQDDKHLKSLLPVLGILTMFPGWMPQVSVPTRRSGPSQANQPIHRLSAGKTADLNTTWRDAAILRAANGYIGPVVRRLPTIQSGIGRSSSARPCAHDLGCDPALGPPHDCTVMPTAHR